MNSPTERVAVCRMCDRTFPFDEDPTDSTLEPSMCPRCQTEEAARIEWENGSEWPE